MLPCDASDNGSTVRTRVNVLLACVADCADNNDVHLAQLGGRYVNVESAAAVYPLL